MATMRKKDVDFDKTVHKVLEQSSKLLSPSARNWISADEYQNMFQ